MIFDAPWEILLGLISLLGKKSILYSEIVQKKLWIGRNERWEKN